MGVSGFYMTLKFSTLQFWPCSTKPGADGSLAQTQQKKIKKGEEKMGFLDLIFLFLRRREAGLWRLLCQGPDCTQKCVPAYQKELCWSNSEPSAPCFPLPVWRVLQHRYFHPGNTWRMEEIVEDKRSEITLLVLTWHAAVADMFCRNSRWVGTEGTVLLAKSIPTTCQPGRGARRQQRSCPIEEGWGAVAAELSGMKSSGLGCHTVVLVFRERT